jgi:hypothetical protein
MEVTKHDAEYSASERKSLSYCPLAQLAEQEAVNFKVAGSSPAGAAMHLIRRCSNI